MLRLRNFPGVLKYSLFVMAVIGCSGGSGTSNNGTGGSQTTPTTASLSITSIAPATVPAGTAQITLTVNGTGFASGATVQIGSTLDPTTFVSSTQLTATVSASQLLNGGMLPVVVSSGGSSTAAGTAVALEVDNPVPAITQLAPSGFLSGAASTVVTVTGTGFVPSTTLQVGGSARTTTYVSSTQVGVTLTAADLATPGNLSLVAVNPAPQGGSSAAAAIAINNPAPSVTSLAPSTVLVGASPATVTVTGSNFLPSSVAQVGSSSRSTTYLSSTQLSFMLQAADQASAGKLAISVVNPSPGGGVSPAVTLTVATPAATPVISSVSPTSFIVSAANSSLQVTGTGFTSASVVQWNGSALTTTYLGSTSLVAVVPANLIASVGSANVTVSSPTASTPLSNAVTVAITNPPAPTLTSLSPNYGPMNVATKVTLTGTGFTANSTVVYNGTALSSTF